LFLNQAPHKIGLAQFKSEEGRASESLKALLDLPPQFVREPTKFLALTLGETGLCDLLNN
jgi:hypothetical protein